MNNNKRFYGVKKVTLDEAGDIDTVEFHPGEGYTPEDIANFVHQFNMRFRQHKANVRKAFAEAAK